MKKLPTLILFTILCTTVTIAQETESKPKEKKSSSSIVPAVIGSTTAIIIGAATGRCKKKNTE
jgi:hypothetical protein